ncbi:response regulator [Pseudochryseolinea flava]|nr:response regulator [Pseudochryseolinea flava]
MKKRILVVEDFASIRKFVCETLGRRGYATIGASNMKEALSLLELASDQIHLVLTDYNMPDGTGLDLLTLIKENDAIKNIPVIILTADTNPDRIRMAKAAGLAAWVKKPYRAETLFTEIEQAIKGGCPHIV